MRIIADDLLKRTDITAGYMPQEYEDSLPFDKNPVEYLCNIGDGDEVTRVRTFLGSMRYTPEEMIRPISGLSGGQKAKLFLMKMILNGCNVLMLDEPTRNLSPLSNPVVREVLIDFSGAIISVSHDLKYIGEVCNKILKLTETGLADVTREFL